MNSEISNVLKLSPVAVVKTDKLAGEQQAPAVRVDEGVNPTVAAEKQAEQAKLKLEDVKEAANKGNTLLQSVNRNLQFKIDDSTKEVVVKIVDSSSGDVVRQIPTEDMLNFIKRMQEMDGQQGSVIQDRA